MADAKKSIEIVEKTVKVEETRYILSLTENEAVAIKTLCGMISGCPTGTSRKYTDTIYYALDNIGVVSNPVLYSTQFILTNKVK